MNETEIRAKIGSFERWHYRFDFDGIQTPIWDPSRVNRHEQRKNHLFDPLTELYGGSLAGKRVLDLGCNAGYWALEAIERGCDFVAGIDGRAMHIEQARFVFEAKDVDKERYEFLQGDIFEMDLSSLGRFDVVLCLGLLYHISKHVELLEKISEVNDDVLLIDTTLSLAPGSHLVLRSESLDSPRDAVDYEIAMTPTRRAVAEMIKLFGYGVVVLKPRFSDYTGCRDFRQGRRRGFLCAKRSQLSRSGLEIEPADAYFHWSGASGVTHRAFTLTKRRVGRTLRDKLNLRASRN